MKPTRPETSRLYATYGADPARWPAELRGLHTGEASAARDEALALDQALALLADAPLPSPGLRRRILLSAAAEPPALRGPGALLRALWQELGGIRMAGPAMAMAMAFGIGLAWMTAPLPDDAGYGAEDMLALMQFDQDYEEILP